MPKISKSDLKVVYCLFNYQNTLLMYCEDQKTLAKQTNAVPLFSSKFFSWKLPAAQVMYSLA